MHDIKRDIGEIKGDLHVMKYNVDTRLTALEAKGKKDW